MTIEFGNGASGLTGTRSSYALCNPEHVITWAGDPIWPVLPGQQCLCGRMRVQYETCEKCGNRRWILVENRDD